MTTPHRLITEARDRFYREFPILRPKQPQPVPEEGRLVLGRDQDGEPFVLDTRLLSAHIDMVGGIGGGKSTAMRHLAWLNMETDPALNRATIVIDPHGQHVDSLFRTTLRRIVQTGLYRRKKVFVIDPNSTYCTGLNLLQSEAEPSVMADHLIEGFERIQGDEILMEKPTLRRALHGLLAVLSELKWSLAQADLLLDPNDPHGIREWALQQIKDRYGGKALMRLQYLAGDPRLRKEFEVETIGTENRLAPLLSSRAMRAVVGSPMFDMRDVLDEGAVVLVNTAGHNATSETAGDLLGKLVMRSVLFGAKRRRTNSLALVFADECARYVSQDWERALAELRKYRVGICSAHQTFAMLGAPDDPVRQAIEQIPATKIAFRLNSMQEAADLAPELMRLNLEMPIAALTKETVVGYDVRRMRNASTGDTVSEGDSFATTETSGTGVTQTHADTEGESDTLTKSKQTSDAITKGRSHSVAEAEIFTRGTTLTHAESDTDSESEGTTTSHGAAHTRGGGTNEQSGTSSGTNFAQAFDVPVDASRSGEQQYNRAARRGIADNRNVSAGYSDGRNETAGRSSNWSDSETEGNADTTQRSHAKSVADAVADSDNFGTSRTVTDTDSESTTHGEAHGLAVAKGRNRSRSNSTALARQTSTATTVGKNFTLATASSEGWAESLVPILAMRPSAVHSLEGLKHMAAEMLCTLPSGVAVVRTVKDGRIEGVIVQVPWRDCLPVSDEQYADDLRELMPYSTGKPMRDAMRDIDDRERKIIGAARAALTPLPEPVRAIEFRVSARKNHDPGDNHD